MEGIEQCFEIVLIEFSIKTQKWLYIGLCKLPLENENNFLNNLSLVIIRLTCRYQNFMLIGNFNMTIENRNLENFMNWFGVECFIIQVVLN